MRQSKQARVILYRNKTDEDQARIINGNRVPATNNEETELIVENHFCCRLEYKQHHLRTISEIKQEEFS